MSFKVEVWGDYAAFNRAELRVERVSYDIITPSAARGLLEAVYWHPGIKWVVDKIHVLSPIRFTNIRRNEVKSKASGSNARTVMNRGSGELYLNRREEIVQRSAVVLRDVRYVIEAHFEMTDKAAPSDNHGKFTDIMRRRLEKGKCYSQPYFGVREFPAHFRPYTQAEILTAYPGETRDLGYMLYDMDYTDPENIQPMFFRAVLVNGTLDLTNCEVVK